MYYLGDSDYVWHVNSTAADNSKDGHSFANAKKTLVTTDNGDGAITAAASGDTIIIWPGTYDEAVNLDTLNKSLTIIGSNREKCIINNATGTGSGIILEDSCELYNLTCKSGTGNGAAGIDCGTKTRLVLVNVIAQSISVTGATDGLLANGTMGLNAKNCVFFGAYDGAVVSNGRNLLFERCHFESTGEYPGTVKAMTSGGGAAGAVFKTCSFYVYRESTEDYKGIAAYSKQGNVFIGCTFHAEGKTLLTGCEADMSALYSGGGTFIGCSFKSIAETGYTALDIESAQPPILCGCDYDPDKVSGIVKFLESGVSIDSNGRFDISKIGGSDASVLETAAKMLTNKAIQTKSTGAIVYYDDDGETPILTHTPIDGDSTITRTPS